MEISVWCTFKVPNVAKYIHCKIAMNLSVLLIFKFKFEHSKSLKQLTLFIWNIHHNILTWYCIHHKGILLFIWYDVDFPFVYKLQPVLRLDCKSSPGTIGQQDRISFWIYIYIYFTSGHVITKLILLWYYQPLFWESHIQQYGSAITMTSLFNTLRQRQNGCHFTDDIFKYIFLNENVLTSKEIQRYCLEFTGS